MTESRPSSAFLFALSLTLSAALAGFSPLSPAAAQSRAQAEDAVRNADAPTIPLERQEGDDWTDFVGAWLLPVVGALLTLIIVGALFWLTWRRIEAVNAKHENLIAALAKRQDEKLKDLKELTVVVSRVTNLEERLVTLQHATFRHTRMIEAPAMELARHGAPVSYEAEEDFVAAAVDFPVTANNLLARSGGPWPVVKVDWMRNLLVRDPDGRGTFVLVHDAGIPGGQLYAVPRLTRFLAAEDFYNHYEQFYDCARPASGEIWVNAPAVVRATEGGWKLADKGELEVKS